MIKFIENTRDSLALAKLHSHESINRMNPLSMTVKICVISDVLVYENWPLKTPKGYSLPSQRQSRLITDLVNKLGGLQFKHVRLFRQTHSVCVCFLPFKMFVKRVIENWPIQLLPLGAVRLVRLVAVSSLLRGEESKAGGSN